MKRATLNHPKLKALISAASITRRDAIGLLTLLWDFTGQYAPTGAIGRYTNAAIAGACDWTECPDELVRHLVRTEWLDEMDDPEIRLVVHDWPDHCEQWVRKRLARDGLEFVRTKCPDEVSGHSGYPKRQPSPSPAKPSQAQPPPAQPSLGGGMRGAAGILRRMKGNKEHVTAVADVLDATQVVAFWAAVTADGKAKHPVSLIAKRIEDGDQPPELTWAAVADAISAKIVVAIDGQPADGLTVRTKRWSDNGSLKPPGAYRGDDLLAHDVKGVVLT